MTPTPYMTLASTQAADGTTGMALDAPLVIHGTAWPSGQADFFAPVELFSVEVKAAGSTAPVAGTLASFFGEVVWQPSAPLAASTTYEVAVHVTNTTPAPADATGPLDQTFSFSTGSALLPPLTITAAPTYSLATRDLPSCPAGQSDDCGHCLAPVTKPTPVVVVSPPAVSGGAAGGGYFVQAMLTNKDGPPAGTLQLSQGLRPEQPGPIEIPLVDLGVDYGVCVHVEVSDATGRSASTETTCFDRDRIAHRDDGVADPLPASTATSSDATASSGGGGDGCSAGGRESRAGALLIGLAAALAHRRRRPVVTR